MKKSKRIGVHKKSGRATRHERIENKRNRPDAVKYEFKAKEHTDELEAREELKEVNAVRKKL